MNNLQIILDIVLILIGLYLVFFKSYFSEKGKNLATKEDIGAITQEIETIKNEVGIHSQIKLKYYFDQKKAAIDFLNSISVWLDYALRPLNVLSNNNTDKMIIANLCEDLKIKAANTTRDYWTILIYFDDNRITNVVDELYNKCIDLNNLTTNMLVTLERKAIEFEFEQNKLRRVNNNIQRDEAQAELELINRKISEIINQYVKDKKEVESQALKLRLKYTVFIGELLKENIINKNETI
jgi:hypothetical protein